MQLLAPSHGNVIWAGIRGLHGAGENADAMGVACT